MTVTFNPIKYTELLSQYNRALEILEELMSRDDRSPEENELYDLLIVLIEKFENEFYQPGSHSNAVSMLQFLMEQQDLNPIHLQSPLGSEQIVAEILAGDRKLSIAQVKNLSNLFKVDCGVFL